MTTWTFSLPVSQHASHHMHVQYMGRQLKMCFRVEEMGIKAAMV